MSDCEIVYNNEHVPVKYTCFDIVYYVYKKKKKWVVRKSMIDAFSFTNILSYKLDNGVYVHDENRLFSDKDEAIKFCLEHNEKNSVKVYNENSYCFL